MTRTAFPLTDDELARLRQDAESTLTDTCELFTPGPSTVDAAGNVIPGPLESKGVFPCMFRTPEVNNSVNETVVVNQPALEIRWNIMLPLAAPVERDSQIVIDGEAYRVTKKMTGGTRAILQRAEVVIWQS